MRRLLLLFTWGGVAIAGSAQVEHPPWILELGISELIAAAEQQDFGMDSATAQAALARERSILVYRALLPTVSFSYGKSDTVRYGAFDERDTRVGVDLRVPLYLGGTVASAIRSQARSAEEALLNASEAQRALVIQAGTAYIDLSAAHAQVGLQSDLAELAFDELSLARKRYELGELTRLDLIATELEYHAVVLEREAAEERLRLAELVVLRFVTGEHRSGIRLIPRDVLRDTPPPKEELFRTMQQAPAENRRLGIQLESARDRYRDARRAWLPRIQLLVGADAETGDSALRNPGYRVGLELSAALPGANIGTGTHFANSGGDTRSRSINASAIPGENLDQQSNRRSTLLELRAAEHAIDEARRAVWDEMARLHIARDHAYARHRHAVEQVTLRREAADLVGVRVALGQARPDEYLRAEAAATRSAIEAQSLLVRIIESDAALLRILNPDQPELSSSFFARYMRMRHEH